jgi:hypothetical protein
MNLERFSKVTTRREVLRATTAFAGGILLSEFVPPGVLARPEKDHLNQFVEIVKLTVILA